MKIKKGDKVKVLLGKDRGKEGVVERVSQKKGQLWILGVNVYKRHVKKQEQYGVEGGVMDIVKPLKVSNVALICPSCQKPTRVGYKITGKEKVRVCRKCRKEIRDEQAKR